MVTSEDTQDATTGSEDTHVAVVEPEDCVDRCGAVHLHHLHQDGGEREMEEVKKNKKLRKITTSCFLCSLFSPPLCCKSSICPNKISLLFAFNSKLVPYSRKC